MDADNDVAIEEVPEAIDESSKPIIEVAEDAPRELAEADATGENQGELRWSIDWGKLLSNRNTDQKLYSDKFEVATYYWRLLAFINNQTRDGPNLALFLDAPEASFTPHHMNPTADFTLKLVNHRDSTKSFQKESKHLFSSKETDWGFNAFFSAQEIQNPANGWLKDNHIEISCSVKVILDASKLDSRKKTGCVGLKNQGATCYMNSLLQYLFHVPFFRNAVYHMPTNENDEIKAGSLPLALQSLFYKLQYSKTAVSTKDLTGSFGWGSNDAFMQHDVQELNRVLCEKLEEKMKGTKVDKVINQLFEGHTLNYIDCINVDFKSTRKESFMDLSLDVKGCKDVLQSFLKYTEVEVMEGENQYQSEKHGLQDAHKGISFINLPPVLQLQLKRFEYDFQRDMNIKINDYYEFPEELDLDFENRKIFASESDSTTVNRYRLHSVLVHSGSVHGGHYYAYITPDGKKWFKFDDEKVDPAEKKEAIVDQYGGGEDGFNRAKFSNAYMLVYIRVSDWDRLMSCGGKEEISEGLRKRFEMEQRDKEARQKMKVEAHMYCTVKVATDEDMMTQVGSDTGGVFFDLADHDQLPSDKIIRLKKGLKFSEIKSRVQELTGVPPSSQRFWTFAENKSQSYRPSKPLSAEDEDKPLMELKDLRDMRQFGPSRKLQSLMDFKFYVQLPRVFMKEGGQILSPQAPLPSYSPKSDILLFFKFYDPIKNTIWFKGSLTVMKSQTVADLSKYCCRMSGLAADTPLDFYEEIRSDPVTVRPLEPRRILCKPAATEDECLADGDIVIYQLAYLDDGAEVRFPRVDLFLEWTRNRCLVTFKRLEEPKESGFQLELLREMEYDKVASLVAAHLHLPDPTPLRFTQYSSFSNGPFKNPIAFGKNPNLKTMLKNNKNSSDIIFYEQLDMSHEEYEKLRVMTLHLHGDKAEWLGAFSIRVPREGSTVQTILAQLRTLIPPALSSRDLRIVETYNCCLFKILSETEKTEDMNDNYWTYRVDPVPAEELNPQSFPEGERLISVCHIDVDKDNGNVKHFGDPFFIRIRDDEAVAEVRGRIKAKLGVSTDEFEKWVTCVLISGEVTLLKDEDSLGPILPKDQTDIHLCLHHEGPKGPLRRREVKGMRKEEAIKINA